VAVACLAIGAVGCSSDSKSDKGSTGTSAGSGSGAKTTRTDTGTSEADLKSAATANATAKLADSAASYDYLAAACKTKYSAASWDANLNAVATILKTALPGIDEAKVGAVATRNVTPVSGEAQVVILAKDGSDLVGAAKAEWGKWVVESSMWVTTDCTSASDLVSGG
jgi:hypothetical protein